MTRRNTSKTVLGRSREEIEESIAGNLVAAQEMRAALGAKAFKVFALALAGRILSSAISTQDSALLGSGIMLLVDVLERQDLDG